MAQAGFAEISSARLVGVCLACGTTTSLVVLSLSHSVVISGFLGLTACAAPILLVRYRQRRRRDALRAVWPDTIDHLASGVRAGLSLPEALVQIGEAGPEALRAPFSQFAEDYRVSGRFNESLDHLKESLADPVGDRVVESLRLAREVGGHDLGRLLRTLSSFLRDDARTRGELESRQSWTVNAARLAVAAPWVLLMLLSLRPEAVNAYDSPAGVLVLVFGAVTSFVAYRLMMRIGRLPVEQRVLR
ncbi:MAG TPA: type II secretion system F family protein [Actinomycetes bacterium]|nr:type II secretion system F family protein [Actinomycetes bacterium]